MHGRDNLMGCTLRLSVERSGPLFAAIKRWVRFAEEQEEYPWRNLAPLHLKEFLQKVGTVDLRLHLACTR